ncbi:MAG TPA: FecR domain-containing protein [Planctomycetaceae bacterium]|jgi:ferric-dicitrate binding protein FerR (iron transport regulator)
MPVSERSRELIQKYLDELASDVELAELEALLTVDPQIADAFAQAMRLNACLRVHFQKQYKIDQIARLLEEDAPSSTAAEKSGAANPDASAQAATAASSTAQAGSIFVPGRGLPREPRSTRRGRPFVPLHRPWGRRSWIAAAVLFLAAGTAVWFSVSRETGGQARIISGRIEVAGREVQAIPEGTLFEVVSRKAAKIELPDGSRLEFSNSTRAVLRRDEGRQIVKLVAGGGDVVVTGNQAVLNVETPLGNVATTGSQFSVILTTASPVQSSATESIRVPQLTVIVARGSVTIERGGKLMTLSAGDERVFF